MPSDLTQHEQILLLSIWRLQDDAYGEPAGPRHKEDVQGGYAEVHRRRTSMGTA